MIHFNDWIDKSELVPYISGFNDHIQKYLEICRNWDIKGISVENACKEDYDELQMTKRYAMLRSGLSRSELTFIALCRRNDLFEELNTRLFILLEKKKQKAKP